MIAAGDTVAQAEDTRAGFVDVTEAVGLSYPIEFPGDKEDAAESIEGGREGAGLALADIDGDGWPELYVAHGRGETGRLFGWNGRRFEPRPGNGGIAPAAMDRAGYFIDLDDDGVPDFLSIHAEGTQAFRNDGSGQFTEMPTPFGAGTDHSVYSMAAADYDGDGDLDPFFAHWNRPWNGLRPPARYLWRNDGKGRYEDVSHIVPIRPGVLPASGERRELSLTPIFADIDGDGDADILLAGDFGTSQVLRNEAGTAFTDITGDGRFEDATEDAGVREGGRGQGACLADFDNDGHRDLFLVNGSFGAYVEDADDAERETAAFPEDPSRLFMANGDGTFTERAAELGVRHTGQGRGVVCADYDGDGRVDILIANHGAAPTVYRNVFERRHHWLAIDLAGRHANPNAVGGRVTVSTASGHEVQEVRLGTAYLSQAPTTLHFGLGPNQVAHAIEVRWPGPGNEVSRLENIAADRRITIYQAKPEGFLLRVARGTGAGHYGAGESAAVNAEPARGHYLFSHWSAEGGGRFTDARAPVTTFAMPAGPATVFAHYLPGPSPAVADVSVARRWMEVLLQAIRDDFARPTVHARNLFHLSAAMYDAWAAWSEAASAYSLGESVARCPAATPPAAGDLKRVREMAISHAAWRLIRHRFQHSPGAASTLGNADTLMAALGHDIGSGAAPEPAATLGACIARFYIARGLEDGSNEADDYASLVYRPVNDALEPAGLGNPTLADPDRWQPLDLELFVGQSGILEDDIPAFVTPEWGRVVPFALTKEDLAVHRRDETDWLVYHDPGPPPALRGPLGEHYKWGFTLVARWSAALSPDDGILIDIAPSGIGNIPALPRSIEDYPAFYDGNPHGPGHAVNPATGKPYEPQIVPLGDYTRVLAEFWADGPDSETPPGHWFVILNAVSDHELLTRRLGGIGPVLDPLEWDVKTYFALGGAMHDAAIASWGIKGWYDSVRPVSALRFMADRGQSSDPALPSWSPEGIPLVPGLIELVGPGDPLAGEDGAHAGKIKVQAWRGPDFVDDPAMDSAGVGWILAENWWPYQRPSFVTPPFAGYVSGHSTYSRAAAEVLTALTGDPFFPGGMSGFRVPANEFLVFERGPSVDMTLQWATYRDAADQCSLSRIWGGIHPPADDIPGRLIGERVGRDAARLALSLFAGGG
ncbi:MAG: FG-GAP-like repeat-containing protein [Rhodospirillales bacterium]|nr:FG-GAP-like repeat-containing protein [Rhodospirillales bacterium]MDE0379037.1 FG-GAP-like repeat-containing protein [Rhodospirillales bacterium]